jgi:hypothetical protein
VEVVATSTTAPETDNGVPTVGFNSATGSGAVTGAQATKVANRKRKHQRDKPLAVLMVTLPYATKYVASLPPDQTKKSDNHIIMVTGRECKSLYAHTSRLPVTLFPPPIGAKL